MHGVPPLLAKAFAKNIAASHRGDAESGEAAGGVLHSASLLAFYHLLG
jgi:hypothetical protein